MATIPKPLESPPRSTGNINQDLPILVNWMWKAYIIVMQAVTFINDQTNENPNLNVNDLPDPETSTIAQAQTTANLSYALADQADRKANALDTRVTTAENAIITLGNRVNNMLLSDTFVITGNFTAVNVTFGTPQPDDNYVVLLQVKDFTRNTVGPMPVGAFIIESKTYSASGFSVSIFQAPGSEAGPPALENSVTYEWQLIRKT